MDRSFAKRLQAAEAKAKKLSTNSHGGLHLPYPNRSQVLEESKFGKMFKTFLTWKDVFDGPLPTPDEIIARAKLFASLPTIEILARINYLWYTTFNDSRTFPIEPLLDYFPPAAQGRIRTHLADGKRIFIPRTALLFLMKTILHHGRSDSGFEPGTHPMEFGELLLACADYSEGLDTTQLEKSEQNKQLHVIVGGLYRNFLVNGMERIAFGMARYWNCLTRYPDEVGENVRHIAEAMRTVDGDGLTVRDEVLCAFAIFSRYASADDPLALLKERPQDFLIDASYFQNMPEALRRAAGIVLARLSRKLPTLASPEPFVVDGGYDISEIYQHPLVRVGAMHFPMDLYFVVNRIAEGIKYRLFETAKKVSAEQFRLVRGEWGHLLEHHARLVLRHYFDSPLLKDRLHDAGFPGVDFIIDDGDTLLFIEVTSSVVPVFVVLSGKWERIKASIDKIFFETVDNKTGKAFKMAKAISDFCAGQFQLPGIDPKRIKKIIPIFVMEQGIPQMLGVSDDLRAEIAKRTGMPEDSARLIEFWDIEEFEICASLLKGRFSQILISKHNDGSADIPMKNFLYWEKMASSTGYMDALYEAATDSVKRAFFSKSDELKRESRAEREP